MMDNTRPRILIADDDRVSRRLLQKLLSDHELGAEILVAHDGEEAWKIINRRFAPIVITDWVMPKMDGLELCRKLRQANFDRYVYIILLTARDDQEGVLQGLHAGADDYVRKPFDQNELQLRVKAGLRVIQLEEELARKHEQLRSLNVKLKDLARIDPLMQVGNRISMYEAIERLHDQTMRYHKSYGLLICDIDHFKLVNDTLGHQAGDKTLFKVARVIKQNIRRADQVFRFGGEEIVVLLPEQDLEGAVHSGERIRQAVQALGIFHPTATDKTLTVSVGAAACEPGSTARDWKEVLEQADKALYQAKAQGRNRVCRYDNEYLVQAT